MQKKIEKMFLSSEIIAFELIAVNTRFYWETIHFIGCQYVNSLKISDTTKTKFLSWFPFRGIKKYGKNTTVKI